MPALPIKGCARTLSSTSLNQIQARSLIFDVCRRSASLDVAVTWLDDDKVRLCKSRLDHVEYNIVHVFRLRVTDVYWSTACRCSQYLIYSKSKNRFQCEDSVLCTPIELKDST